jgi:hypothetical protein
MRPLVLLALLALSAAGAESVPFDTISWAADSGSPTPAGIARRVQVYFLINFEDPVGMGLYWNVRGAYGQRYPTSYTVQVFLIGSRGQLPTRNDTDPPEYWDKGFDSGSGLVQAFAGGDASAALVVVDGNGKITTISRLGGSADAERKGIEALFKETQPLIDNEGMFPLSLKSAIKWLRIGDLNRAMKESQKLGGDGMTMVKTIGEQSNRLIETDTKVLNDPAAPVATRLISYLRLGSLLDEFPSTPAHTNAAKALKAVKGDKQLNTELEGWGMLQEYYKSMKRIQAKKAIEVQQQWLPMITAKYSGTYAAEIATMIKHASRLDQ